MKSNIKRLSLCLSALMLLILASPLTVLAAEEEVTASAKFYGTFWSLVPPLVAIALALITKEVYSSLFVGILVGALFYSNFNFEGTILHIFEGGMISVLTDSYNMGILIFLVILGTMVCLMNRAGGSAAFGRLLASIFSASFSDCGKCPQRRNCYQGSYIPDAQAWFL